MLMVPTETVVGTGEADFIIAMAAIGVDETGATLYESSTVTTDLRVAPAAFV